MEETKNEKCDVCNTLSKCCCAKHKIIHILVWILVGLAIFCAGISIGARTGHFKNNPERFGRFENKIGCQNADCPMLNNKDGIRPNFRQNCIGAIQPTSTTKIDTSTLE